MKRVILKNNLWQLTRFGIMLNIGLALKNTAPNWSYVKYLKGVDLKLDQDRNIVQVARR